MNRAWLAGFFDGEGSISYISATLDQPNRRPVVVVTLSQTMREPLDAVESIYGGRVLLKRFPLSRKPCWQWQSAAGSVVVRFLTDLLPYLWVKRTKAIEVLAVIGQPYDPTRCAKGHPFDKDNTVLRRDGRRRCRACLQARYPRTKGPYRRSARVQVEQDARWAARPDRIRAYPE